jgi:hypothetical protein
MFAIFVPEQHEHGSPRFIHARNTHEPYTYFDAAPLCTAAFLDGNMDKHCPAH